MAPNYIDSGKPLAFTEFTDAFSACLQENLQDEIRPVVLLCIGTDRSTGDSLGPLVGYKLSGFKIPNVHVYGTLDDPVHAKNLEEILQSICQSHENPVVVAIDACLGSMDHIGYITVSSGGLKPGSGVNKDLPRVGDMAITGIVNFNGFMEFMVLQNTRLSLVMKMADIITMGVRYVLWKQYSPQTVQKKQMLRIEA